MPRTPPRYNCGREVRFARAGASGGPYQDLEACRRARLHVVLPVGVQVLGREGARLLRLRVRVRVRARVRVRVGVGVRVRVRVS